MLSSIMLLFVSVPLLFFPKRLPAAPANNVLTKDAINSSSDVSKENTEKTEKKINEIARTEDKFTGYFLEKPLELLREVHLLFKNPVFICLTIGTCIEYWQFSIYFMFLPKYMESQFGISAAEANSINGK